MTDALMGQGRNGAELLAVMMGEVFDPLVEAVFGQEGFITGYAGDSISAVYPIRGGEGSGEVEAARRALASAEAVQRGLTARSMFETAYGGFKISAKIGLGLGEVSWGILQSREGDTATYYFRGEAIAQAAEAEHHALRGEIVLSESIRSRLGDWVRTRSHQAIHLLERGPASQPAMKPIHLPPIDVEAAAKFAPTELITQDLRGEFRQTVHLFLRIPEPSQVDLQEFAEAVLDLQRRYGGLLDRIDFGDKGCSVLMVWGAPAANENDIERAVNFVLELQKRSRLPVSAGITYDRSHAGYVGGRLYETYAAYGWGANLAARFMMGAAESQVWLDERIYERIRQRFNADFAAEQSFKGFAQKQKVYLLRGPKSGPEALFRGRMVGRDRELAALTDFVAPLWQGKYAGVAGVWGEAGMGKSRLVYEFRRRLLAEGKTCAWALCQCDEIVRRSLNPFRYWLNRYFELRASDGNAVRMQKFITKLDEVSAAAGKSALAQELKRAHAFLAPLVELEWPDAQADQLDAQGRYDNTILALISLFKAKSLRQPLMVLVEDAQYLDEDSKAFIPRLKRALQADPVPHPIAILMTTRWQGTRALMEEGLMDRDIDLDALDERAISEMCADFLGQPAAPTLSKQINERAEGNPFFTEQILRYLQEQGLLESDEAGQWRMRSGVGATPIPTDISAMLLARLDKLPGPARAVIQAASALGRAFEVPVLRRMLGSDSLLQEGLAAAEGAAIWSPLSGERYIFNHALLRDMAYNMQLQSRRQQLHIQAYAALKEHYAGGKHRHYTELAYHSEQGGLVEEARGCLELAGDAARDQYQNAQALELYRRALALGPGRSSEDSYRLHKECEKIVTALGRPEERAREIEAMAALADETGQPGHRAEVVLLQARLAGSKGEYGESAELAERAGALALESERTDVAIGAQTELVRACYRRGQYKEAAAHGESGVALARKLGAAEDEATILNLLGLAFLDAKNPSVARTYFEQGMALCREKDNVRGLARVLSNLGNVAGYQGNYTTALDYYEQALRLAREIGERKVESVQLGNVGWISGLLGDYAKAQTYVVQALQICREIGDRYGETYWLVNLSSYAAALGEAESAIGYAKQGLALARRSSDRSAEAWGLTYLGHGHFELGMLEAAQEAYAEALGIRRELDQSVLATEPAAGLARTCWLQGEHEEAETHVGAVLGQLEQDGTLEGTDQPLRVYLNCYLVLEAMKDPRAAGILNRAHDMLRTRANGIADPAVRKVFLEDITYNREILALWEKGR